MKYRTRTYYTETDKALMWEHWKQGDSLHEIARLFDRHHGSIRGILTRSGVVETHLPGRREYPGVTRDNLSQPVHPSPGRVEKGAAATSQDDACDASLSPLHAQG